MARVTKTATCWEWTGSRDRKGYGRIRVNDRPELVHRVSWELFNGESPADKHVCHRCDNPSCVRPEHLFLGDPIINVADKMAKKRHRFGVSRGSAHGCSVLTENRSARYGQAKARRDWWRRSTESLVGLFGKSEPARLGDTSEFQPKQRSDSQMVKYIGDSDDAGWSFGQSASDLISFYGFTPVAQQADTSQSIVLTTALTTITDIVTTASLTGAFNSVVARVGSLVTLVNRIRTPRHDPGVIKGSI